MLNCLKFSNILKYSLATAGVLAWFSASAQVDEIVITAQKRAQGLQDAALSVSAFSGDYLRENKVYEPRDLFQGILKCIAGNKCHSWSASIVHSWSEFSLFFPY